MQFFTPEWHEGEVSDDEFEAVPVRYAAHIAALAPNVPPAVRELAVGRSLHDGTFGRVIVDRRRRRVTLELRVGDQQVGYADLQLIYEEVDLTRLETATLRAAVDDSESELLYDEVDQEGEGRFVHRVLFFPYREVDIAFGVLHLSTQTRPDRHSARPAPTYIEKGAPAV